MCLQPLDLRDQIRQAVADGDEVLPGGEPLVYQLAGSVILQQQHRARGEQLREPPRGEDGGDVDDVAVPRLLPLQVLVLHDRQPAHELLKILLPHMHLDLLVHARDAHVEKLGVLRRKLQQAQPRQRVHVLAQKMVRTRKRASPIDFADFLLPRHKKRLVIAAVAQQVGEVSLQLEGIWQRNGPVPGALHPMELRHRAPIGLVRKGLVARVEDEIHVRQHGHVRQFGHQGEKKVPVRCMGGSAQVHQRRVATVGSPFRAALPEDTALNNRAHECQAVLLTNLPASLLQCICRHLMVPPRLERSRQDRLMFLTTQRTCEPASFIGRVRGPRRTLALTPTSSRRQDSRQVLVGGLPHWRRQIITPGACDQAATECCSRHGRGATSRPTARKVGAT
mmetsp:Transcript_101321/g.325617  ORF Transcript_101321/g.325617 Transcript_101321/m.325617 type:complete len:393 (-) Transcript_101321:76-1254(-)